jgi:hypothetical protein
VEVTVEAEMDVDNGVEETLVGIDVDDEVEESQDARYKFEAGTGPSDALPGVVKLSLSWVGNPYSPNTERKG